MENGDKTIYILSGIGQGSTRIVSYQLIAFSIREELVAENIFEGEYGKPSNQITVSYDLVDSSEYLSGDDFPRPSIEEETKTLRVPRVEENRLTGAYARYAFDGQKFTSPLLSTDK